MPSELARSERLARAADRRDFVITRATLRHILASDLGLEPGAVRLVEPELGKPRLCASHARAEIDFNVSHTDAMSLIALARHAVVGADIERCRRGLRRARAARARRRAADTLALR